MFDPTETKPQVVHPVNNRDVMDIAITGDSELKARNKAIAEQLAATINALPDAMFRTATISCDTAELKQTILALIRPDRRAAAVNVVKALRE